MTDDLRSDDQGSHDQRFVERCPEGERPVGERSVGERPAGQPVAGGCSAGGCLDGECTADECSDGSGVLERDVRAMLLRAVAEVQADPGALPRIQRAVPQRRARHRNVWTGVAAVMLCGIAAVPTLHGIDRIDLSDSPADGRSIAESDRTIGPGPSGGLATRRPHAPQSASDGAAPVPTAAGTAGSTGGTSSTVVEDTPASTIPAPLCLRSDLGQITSHLSTADSSGKVYGWFTLLNTSGRSCKLTGAGTLQIGSVSGADPAQVRVADYRLGDPATGLPDPGAPPPSMVLEPLEGYRIQFGWVPGSACPSSSATVAATGSGGAGAGEPVVGASGADGSGAGTVGTRTAGSAGTASPSPGVGGGALASDAPSPGPPASPTTGPTATATPTPTDSTSTLTLVHTPQSGGPVSMTVVVKGACGGTVYRAALQEVEAPAPTSSPAPTGR